MVCCPNNMTLHWHGNIISYLDQQGRILSREYECLGSPMSLGSWAVRIWPKILPWSILPQGGAANSCAFTALGKPLGLLSWASLFSGSHQVELLGSGPVVGQVLSVLTCSGGCGLWLWLPELLLLLGRSHAHKGNASSCWKKKNIKINIYIWRRKRRAASFVGQPHSYATLTVRFLNFHASEGHLQINWDSSIIVTGKFKGISRF